MNPETSNTNKAHKIKIIIGVSLPVLVILLAMAVTFLPNLFFNPKYDFIYALNDRQSSDYSYYYMNNGNVYDVVDGKLTMSKPVLRPEYVSKVGQPGYEKIQDFAPTQSLYRYKVATNTFEPITFEKAQAFTLTGNGSAPDGTILDNPGYYRGSVTEELFVGSYRGDDDINLMLRNGVWSKKISITNVGSNYYRSYYGGRDFNFLGWVVSE